MLPGKTRLNRANIRVETGNSRSLWLSHSAGGNSHKEQQSAETGECSRIRDLAARHALHLAPFRLPGQCMEPHLFEIVSHPTSASSRDTSEKLSIAQQPWVDRAIGYTDIPHDPPPPSPALSLRSI